MIDVEHDSKALAELYDQVSIYQFRNGLALLDRLGLAAGDKVLDLGCGTGRLALYSAGIAGHVTGIDPSPQRIEVALRNLGRAQDCTATFELGSSSDLRRYGESSFDVVFLNAVFHWIDDKEEALDNIYHVLKPGGRLGICTGDKDRPFTAKVIATEALLTAGIGNAGAGANTHVNATELEALLRKAGFEAVEIRQKRDPRYFKSPEQCLEYVEASSYGNFFGGVPEAALGPVKARILGELEKGRTPQGIESVYHLLFAFAEKP